MAGLSLSCQAGHLHSHSSPLLHSLGPRGSEGTWRGTRSKGISWRAGHSFKSLYNLSSGEMSLNLIKDLCLIIKQHHPIGRGAWFLLVPDSAEALRYFQVFWRELSAGPSRLPPHLQGCSEASALFEVLSSRRTSVKGHWASRKPCRIPFFSLGIFFFLSLCFSPSHRSQGPEYLFICFQLYISKLFPQLLGTVTGDLEHTSPAPSQDTFRAKPANVECSVQALLLLQPPLLHSQSAQWLAESSLLEPKCHWNQVSPEYPTPHLVPTSRCLWMWLMFYPPTWKWVYNNSPWP